jgi:hypothetical protein
MFSDTVRDGLYREPIGFAQAQMLVRALRVLIKPALATLTVCCSIVCIAIQQARMHVHRYHDWSHPEHFCQYALPGIGCGIRGSNLRQIKAATVRAA